MHTIYVFGLGPASIGEMPKKIYDVLLQQKQLHLRTLQHPAAQDLKKKGVSIQSFDTYYEKYDENFEKVYEKIVETLIHEAQNKDVYYGVPGHPSVAETTVQLLQEKEAKIKILGGKSFIDDMFAAIQIDPIHGFHLVDSYDLNPDTIFPGNQLIVMQVFHPLIASEVKLALMEIYPDEHKIAIVDAAGSADEDVQWVPLYELDYFEGVHNLRSIYVPPLKRDEAKASFPTLQSYVDEIFGEHGDVWVKNQTNEDLLPYFQEELDELKLAFKKNDINNVVEELGDLFMQVMYQTALGEKNDLFSFEEVLIELNKKIRRRHPHVFDGVVAQTPEEVDALWQKIKNQEKRGGY